MPGYCSTQGCGIDTFYPECDAPPDENAEPKKPATFTVDPAAIARQADRVAALEAENERLRWIIETQMIDGKWWLAHKSPKPGCVCGLCNPLPTQQ